MYCYKEEKSPTKLWHAIGCQMHHDFRDAKLNMSGSVMYGIQAGWLHGSWPEPRHFVQPVGPEWWSLLCLRAISTLDLARLSLGSQPTSEKG